MKHSLKPFILILFMVITSPGRGSYQRGILNQPAPPWLVTNWFNLPKGKKRLDIEDFHGKVLYLFCFQSWCPGCHSRGFPTLKKMISHFGDNQDVAFVAIQTVFEGFGTNTFKRAKSVGKEYDLTIPIGQSGDAGKHSELMQRYRTGGTPWTIIIDQKGIVRFNDFHVSQEKATRLIQNLLKSSQKIPASRGGKDMLGKPLPLAGIEWINTPEKKPLNVKGKVTLVRWWTFKALKRGFTDHSCQYETQGEHVLIDHLCSTYGLPN